MSTILGIDIDPHTVRAVVVKTALRKSTLAAYVGIPLPPVMTPEERTEQLRGAIKQVLGTLPHPPDRVITELSGDEVSVRKLSFPSKVAKKIDDLLPNELDGIVPFDPLESVIDHQLIETVGPEMKLLAAVAPKDKVRAHLDLMTSIGIDPREIAVGAVALDGSCRSCRS
jgi:Tfp pilus assembly PilM family ATPase